MTTSTRARIAVISASVREQRMGRMIADWVRGHFGDDEAVDLLDIAEITLPDDSLLYPGGGPKSEVSDRIAEADAFVFVTPEYNHSYPASLKRLIDWHYSEWQFKPATIVAYGVHGGHAAIEHLRGVLAELNMVTTRRVMGIRAPWQSMTDGPRYEPEADVTTGLKDALSELRWWADVLGDARRTRPFGS